MKKLLEKILWIESELNKVKSEIRENIENEKVEIVMTKKEWKYIRDICFWYYNIYRAPISEEFWHKVYEPFRKLDKIVDSF